MWHAKPKKSRCNCRKRRRHNPKVGDGICRGSAYRPAVVARIAGRRLARLWLEAARANELERVDV